MLKLGDLVPDFTADSTKGEIHFYDFIEGSWAILVSNLSVRGVVGISFWQFFLLIWRCDLLIAWSYLLLHNQSTLYIWQLILQYFYICLSCAERPIEHYLTNCSQLHAVFSSCRFYSGVHHRYWNKLPATQVFMNLFRVIQLSFVSLQSKTFSTELIYAMVDCPLVYYNCAPCLAYLIWHSLESKIWKLYAGAKSAHSPHVLSKGSVWQSWNIFFRGVQRGH